MKPILAAIAISLVGCARSPLVAPNPTAVHSSISRVDTGVSKAEEQRRIIAARNAEARYNAMRADNKDKFLDAYRKWKEKQR
jgi:hypothetical protein